MFEPCFIGFTVMSTYLDDDLAGAILKMALGAKHSREPVSSST